MIASTVTRPWVLAAILQARGYPVADLAPADATAALDELLTAGVISVSFGPTQSARIAEPPPHWERAQPVLDQAWDEMIAIASLVGQVTINLRLDAAGRRLLDALPSISTLPTGERLRLHPDLDIVEESPARAAPGDRPGEYPTDAGFFGDAGAEPPEPPEPPEPCEAEAESPKADERRLQARVQDALGVTLTAGFLAGQKQLVSVRIAAEVAAGATPAEVPFPTPTPGRAVTLDVVLRVQTSQAAPVKRKLRLPTTAGSAWTRAATLELPAKGRQATVEILILHQGRAVQTALLTGPLLTKRSGRSKSPFTMSIDETMSPSALPNASAAGATVVVSMPENAAPLVFDPLKQRVPFDAKAIDAAGQDLRSLLFAALAAPPESLRAAAPVLTKLAILGATLHRHLVAAAGKQLADASWIHVLQLGTSDIPFEIAYTHPMPERDDEVSICAPATAGATSCPGDCPDRGRSDRVCPFGFWGTSKVVERRVHSAGRRSSMASQPSVSLACGAVIATAKVTDQVDTQASARIAAAVQALVAPGSCQRAECWDDLAREVRAGPGIVVLITHTAGDGPRSTTVEIGTEPRPTYRLDCTMINPGLRDPGPIVLSIGCDTGHLDAGFATWVQTVQDAKASVVVSALSPVSGRAVADFVERFAAILATMLAEPGEHRIGAALTRARQQTLAAGDLLGLALTATGDGDIRLAGG